MTPSQTDRDAAAKQFRLNPTDFFDEERLAMAFAAHRRAALEEAASLLDRYVTPFGRAGSAPDAVEGQMHKMAQAIRAVIDKEPT